MDFVFGIVTYHRPDRQKMLEYLHGLGYGKEDIILQTQDKGDYEALTGRYDEWATILYKPGNNVSENKNNLLDWVCEKLPGKRLVICSDKVRGIKILPRQGKSHTIQQRQTMDFLVRKMFWETEQLGGLVFGCYPVQNDFFMKHTTSINQLIVGCFMGLPRPTALRFDTGQPIKEDFELVLRIVKNGGKVIRFNDVCLHATFHTKGGCHDLWNAQGDAVNKACTERILTAYPGLAKPHATRQNEIKYIGKTETINKSVIYD